MASASTFDVAVVGSGGAGLSAALAASVRGSRVVVLEKSELLGGTTALSGGSVWVPCNHHQGVIGVKDDREDALTYLRSTAPDGWHNVEEALWVSFVDHAPDMLRFLEQNSPLRFAACKEPDPYAEAPGGKAFGRSVSPGPLRLSLLGDLRDKLRGPQFAPWLNYEEVVDTEIYSNPRPWIMRFLPRMLYRRLTGRRVMGNALIIGLLRGCLDQGCQIWPATQAENLITNNGRITGLQARRGGEPVDITIKKAVVLASGGFEWDEQMMAEHFPGMSLQWRGSPSTNTGDGHRMARDVGAKLDRMDQALLYATLPEEYEGGVRGKPVADETLPHAMLVNRHGRRFVNEKQHNDGTVFLERDPVSGEPAHLPAWRIYDAQFTKKYAHALPKDSPHGTLYKAASLAELAHRIGIDGKTLVGTAKRVSDFARNGIDEDFGRGNSVWDRNRGADSRVSPNTSLGTIEVPPFYAFPFVPSFLGTKGGPRTNARGQVVDEHWDVIPGLYAAGNLMANPFGTKGVGGGTTLGPVLTWGYICGTYASRETGM
jgi:3-oxosteroid 1-dehydrogenase